MKLKNKTLLRFSEGQPIGEYLMRGAADTECCGRRLLLLSEWRFETETPWIVAARVPHSFLKIDRDWDDIIEINNIRYLKFAAVSNSHNTGSVSAVSPCSPTLTIVRFCAGMTACTCSTTPHTDR